MRFRARIPYDQPVIEGDRLVFTDVVDEWDHSTGGGRSLVPRDVFDTRPRPGRVVKVLLAEDATRDVFADDLPAKRFETTAIMTVLGPRTFASPGRVIALLAHLATRDRIEGLHVGAYANALTPWLRERFPDVARASDAAEAHSFATSMEWQSWAAGVCDTIGATRDVWPARLLLVEQPTVLPDAVPVVTKPSSAIADLLRQQGRAN